MTHDRAMALIQWANELRGQPFVWGRTDCLALVAQAAAIITGAPLASLPAWTDEATARAVAAVTSPAEILEAAGFHLVDGRGLMLGDIVLAPAGWCPMAGHIVFGRHALTSAQDHGVGYVRTDELRARAVSAWRCG